ncbi:MAG TPA: glycosyltransferase family 2 protein [Polyangiaceae bacterium]|nr:glycosyltransferase family 2 protein [Polyangiaceae bacterium]
MWHGAKLAIIMPAYREERLVARALGRLPAYVDRVYVVDDASPDATADRIANVADERVCLLRHESNQGVGAAIGTGYRRALADGIELLAVMAADDQMDPEDLPRLLDAVAGGADYAKGNRFLHREARRMPLRRRLGSRFLSLLTRAATSLPVDDCQCGYTVLSAAAARQLPLRELWPRYGYPNDLIGMLAAAGCRVAEVPVRPVYADEVSGLRGYHVFVISAVIARRWWRSRGRALAVSAPAVGRLG